MGQSKKDVGVTLRKDHATFRVWAPFACAVDVTGAFNDWGRSPMLSEGDGYWVADVQNVEAGQEYKFVLNTGQWENWKNDPRSMAVTTNFGNSVIVEDDFHWEDGDFKPKPLNEQVIYEMHVGTFNRPDPSVQGTFETVTEKLEYLANLGITTIELMPIGSMPNDRGWGYAVDYMYAVETLYGGRLAFMEFVNAAHNKGIAVILDVVYNHFGPGGGLDLWQMDGWHEDNKGGIYFYNDWRSQTPWGDTRPDYGREEVRQYILDNVRMWMSDCHLDGLRLDSTCFMRNVHGNNDDPANDLPEAWGLMQDINDLVREIKPSAITIAEDLGCNEYITKTRGEGGAGFLAQWEVAVPGILRRALEATDDAWRHLGDLAGVLERRFSGDAFRRIIYTDSHDSAANDGAARLSEEISPGNPGSLFSKRRSLIASALVLTAPGVPMLLQGQEFLEGGSFSDWRALDWKRAKKLSGMVQAHKHLIALRKNEYGNTVGLIGQSFTILHLNEESKVLAYHRWDQGGPGDDVVVVINLANRAWEDYIVNFPRSGVWKVRFNSDWKGYSSDFTDSNISEVTVDNGVTSLAMAPYSVLILSQD